MFSETGRFEKKPLEVIKQSVRALGPLESLPPDEALFTEAFLPK